jgi:hypothetical protein
MVVDAFLRIESHIESEGERMRELEGLLEFALEGMKGS